MYMFFPLVCVFIFTLTQTVSQKFACYIIDFFMNDLFTFFKLNFFINFLFVCLFTCV